MCLRFFSIPLVLCGFYFSSWSQTQKIDSLKQIISFGKKNLDEANTFNRLADEYIRHDVTKAKNYIYQAIYLANVLENERSLSTSYSQMVTLFHNLGNVDSAFFYLNTLKNLANQSVGPDTDVIKANYFSTAGLYYKKSGNLNQAIPFYKAAITLAEKTGNKLSVAGQFFNLGNTYMNLGDYKNALHNHLKALGLFEELGNQKGVSFCYQSISNSFIELKQFDQALKYANKSIAIKRSLDDKRGLGTSEISLGLIYFGMENYEKALFHYNAALLIAREFKLVPDETKIFFNMAKVYAAKKELKTATEYFNQTKQLAKQIADSSTIASVDMQLLAMQSNVAKMEQSEKKLTNSLSVFESTGNVAEQVSGYQSMAEFYKANNEFEKALQYTNKYHQLNDSIQNNELKLQLKKMEAQYNDAKAEKEIAILKKDQQLKKGQLKQQQLYLIATVTLAFFAIAGIWMTISRNQMRGKMKELKLRNQIAADLHDEVGSSLSSIHMLSQIATQKQPTDASQKEILDKVSSNAKETMEKMSDIVWMIKPGENEGENLKQRMERFAYEISSSKNINTSIELNSLEKAKLTMPQRKNLYLLFKEALNNAVKYSGTEKIEIKSSIQNNQLLLSIKDYGKGFDLTATGRGNGLDNMKNRAKELNGKLDISSLSAAGTSVTLLLPI
jgi:two-component system, NarL family, sensor histidine kinase UhpB